MRTHDSGSETVMNGCVIDWLLAKNMGNADFFNESRIAIVSSSEESYLNAVQLFVAQLSFSVVHGLAISPVCFTGKIKRISIFS
jgi:hypothetical protein